MKQQRSKWILASILVLAACGGTSLNRAFKINIQVNTPAGDAVEGLEVRLHVPVNGASIKHPSKRAATSIEFAMPVQAHAQIDIVDLDGKRLRRLVYGQLVAGVHQVVFDGVTDSNLTLAGTVPFYVEATFREEEEGQGLWRDRTACVLYTGPDEEQLPLLGTTDEAGRLELDDDSPYPFLWNLPTLEGRDETGEPVGELTLTSNVELWLKDPSTGETQVEIVDVEYWGAQASVLWEPEPPVAEPEDSTTAPVSKVGYVPEIPQEFRLNVCFPNPFN